MGLPIKILSGTGKKQFAEVTEDNELLVTTSSYPPFKSQKIRPFRQYFTIDGTPSGDKDMGVDGSVTPQDFYIPSADGFDRYILAINIIVGYGTQSQPFKFADGTALTNGCRLSYESILGNVDIHEGIKSNQDVFRLSDDPITSLWEVRGVNALNDYGYFMTSSFSEISSQYGIKLDEGTTQRISMEIRDDCTNADSFNIIAYGFERFK
jgi:hypothetical protein